MPMYDVEYEYLVPKYGVVRIEAKDIDAAENIALNQLWEDSSLEETNHIHIETVKEVDTPNA